MIPASKKGTYALIFKAKRKVCVRVGRLGEYHCSPGYYVYVGSAMGPGGVAARVKHHLAIAKKPHWHLDYLRPSLVPLEIWFHLSTVRREHQWAGAFLKSENLTIPIVGFGASDCKCPAHLFYSKQPPSLAEFNKNLRSAVTVVPLRIAYGQNQ